ncbi:MAG: hypothetical protein V4487_02790 [Chlamydiota bacterium]
MTIGLDSLDRFDAYSECRFFNEFWNPESALHEAIFTSGEARRFSKSAVVIRNSAMIDERIEKIFANNGATRKPYDVVAAGGSVGGKITVEFGGPNGVEYSTSITAEAHDDRGNSLEFTIEKKNDGPTTVEIYGDHKVDDKKGK